MVLPRQARDKHNQTREPFLFWALLGSLWLFLALFALFLRSFWLFFGLFRALAAGASYVQEWAIYPTTGQKTPFFAPFIYKMHHFSQDRLGTNIRKALKKEWRFLIEPCNDYYCFINAARKARWVRKTTSFVPFILKRIILPGQARDKHRES
jgi:hypothetical protein